MTKLGRLEKIDLRQEWPTEAQDFTPWLAQDENLELLGKTLGLDLELEAVEQNVGPFRADILCKDTRSDRWVLVENQLERTDHTHLGQLITYAAGLEAVTIVWIASRFAEEHRAAMDWLNEITGTENRFFALEVELWRIGDSPAAPKFNVVSQPNDWSRSTTRGKRAIVDPTQSPTKRLQQEYWDTVEASLQGGHTTISPVKAFPQSWIGHGIGKTGVLVSMVMHTRVHWIRSEIYLGGKWAKSYYSQLEGKKVEIETKFGQPLDWQALPGKQDSRICITMDADPTDRSDWPRQHKWLTENLIKLHDVFRPYIAALENMPHMENDSD